MVRYTPTRSLPWRVQRRAQAVEHQAQLKVRYDKGGGQDFKAEDPRHRGLLQVRGNQGVAALGLQGFGNLLEHFHKVGPRAATGVEDDHVGVGQAVGKAEFFAQDGIHAGNLILDDFRRGEPDAKFLAQFRVEGFKERLVEILNGVFVLELLEEVGAVHAVQGGGRPVQHFHQPQRAKFAGLATYRTGCG